MRIKLTRKNVIFILNLCYHQYPVPIPHTCNWCSIMFDMSRRLAAGLYHGFSNNPEVESDFTIAAILCSRDGGLCWKFLSVPRSTPFESRVKKSWSLGWGWGKPPGPHSGADWQCGSDSGQGSASLVRRCRHRHSRSKPRQIKLEFAKCDAAGLTGHSKAGQDNFSLSSHQPQSRRPAWDQGIWSWSPTICKCLQETSWRKKVE